ncbi:MAG TPA: PilZ domain-containing protein [Candidatus Baltobacteraceae bacterium]|nr:PilZ domain-containing protein [Candidatus Baltobacteraceae bacterium]
MLFSQNRTERLIYVGLLCIALLMAIEPLVKIHDPNGSRARDAFDLDKGIAQLESELRIVAPIKSAAYSGPAVSEGVAPAARPGLLPIPFSIRMAPIVPWCVLAALVLGFLALLDLLFLKRWFELLSLFGGFASAIALIQVLILGSDLLAWTDTLMSINELSTPSDSAMGERILMANSFLVSPGIGLYVLATFLLLVPFLSVTRTIPRLAGVIRSARRIRTSQPIHIRPINSQFSAETCMSLDLSQSGLYLESPSDHYYVGMELYLTRNKREGTPAIPEEHGYVVRVEKKDKGGCRFAIHVISHV